MSLQKKVQENTSALIASFSGLNQTEAEFKPSENVWSVLECVEHIFLIDNAVVKIIGIPPPAETMENDKTELFSAEKLHHILVTKREMQKVPAPDSMVPKGILKTKLEAEQSINSVSSKISSLLDANDITKETHTIKHPRLGEMTKLDWVHFMIAHTNRHILQIEELKIHPDFPVSKSI